MPKQAPTRYPVSLMALERSLAGLSDEEFDRYCDQLAAQRTDPAAVERLTTRAQKDSRMRLAHRPAAKR